MLFDVLPFVHTLQSLHHAPHGGFTAFHLCVVGNLRVLPHILALIGQVVIGFVDVRHLVGPVATTEMFVDGFHHQVVAEELAVERDAGIVGQRCRQPDETTHIIDDGILHLRGVPDVVVQEQLRHSVIVLPLLVFV